MLRWPQLRSCGWTLRMLMPASASGKRHLASTVASKPVCRSQSVSVERWQSQSRDDEFRRLHKHMSSHSTILSLPCCCWHYTVKRCKYSSTVGYSFVWVSINWLIDWHLYSTAHKSMHWACTLQYTRKTECIFWIKINIKQWKKCKLTFKCSLILTNRK